MLCASLLCKGHPEIQEDDYLTDMPSGKTELRSPYSGLPVIYVHQCSKFALLRYNRLHVRVSDDNRPLVEVYLEML